VRNTAVRTAALLLATGLPVAVAAQDRPAIDLSADARLRLEQDWDSQTATGAQRLDRARSRIRLRAQATIDFGDGFRLMGRVRTDTPDSQQNANVTFADFDGNPSDHFLVVEDRYSLAWSGKQGSIEVGRMTFPFFTQNEYFWDADIDPLGGTGSVVVPLAGKNNVRLSGGAFKLPVGLAHFSSRLFAGQAVLTRAPLTLAAGVFRFDADRADPDRLRLRLLDNNGSRDYTVLALNGQYRLPAGGKPLVLGADLYRNVQGYAASADPISRANRDQRTGYVLSAAWGDVARHGHLQLGYRWSHMEKLAVNASYAHDDVARLGNAQQSALTDLKGHDIFANYAITNRMVIGARAMFMQRITNREDGNRGRIDLSYTF